MANMAVQRNQSMAAAGGLNPGSINNNTGQISFKKNFSLKLGKDAIDQQAEAEPAAMQQPNFSEPHNLRIIPEK